MGRGATSEGSIRSTEGSPRTWGGGEWGGKSPNYKQEWPRDWQCYGEHWGKELALSGNRALVGGGYGSMPKWQGHRTQVIKTWIESLAKEYDADAGEWMGGTTRGVGSGQGSVLS